MMSSLSRLLRLVMAVFVFGILGAGGARAQDGTEPSLASRVAGQDLRPLMRSVEADGAAPTARSCIALEQDGAASAVWRVMTGVSMGGGYGLSLIRDAGEERILHADWPFTAIATRTIDDRRLDSAPFALRAGEVATLCLDAAQEIPPFLEFRLVAEADYLDRRFDETALHSFYFGAGMLLLLFFVTFSILLRSVTARRYAVFYACLLIFLGSVHGYVGYWLLPSMPEIAGLLLYVASIAIAVAYMRFVSSFFAGHGAHGRIRRVAHRLIALALVVAVLELTAQAVFGLNIHARNAGALLMVGASLWAAREALRHRVEGAVLFALGALILSVYVGGGVAAQYLVSTDHYPLVADATMLAQLLDGLVFAAAIVQRAFGLRRDRDAARDAELAAARETIALNAALSGARQDRDEAKRLAETRRERLAFASHDMRQPLASLRLALEEAERAAPDLGGKLRSAIDYLDGVIGSALHETRGAAAGDPEAPQASGECEAMPLQLVFDNLDRMFADEAAAKGLRLRFHPTSAVVEADPMALIRILSNLVSNAVKYTETGGVLVGARRRGGSFSVEIHDTGPGFSPQELERAADPYWRGEGTRQSVAGEGIGLGAAREAAQANGWRLALRSEAGRGTRAVLLGLGRAA